MFRFQCDEKPVIPCVKCLSSTETDCQFANWFADQHLLYTNRELVSRSKEIVRIAKTTYPSEKEGELF